MAAPGRFMKLKAHGTAVGLPSDDDMGNSEVGHNALGSGRIVLQGAALVDTALQTGAIFEGEGWLLEGDEEVLFYRYRWADGNKTAFSMAIAATGEDGGLQGGGARRGGGRQRGEQDGSNERANHAMSPERKTRTDPGHRIQNIAGIGAGSSLGWAQGPGPTTGGVRRHRASRHR